MESLSAIRDFHERSRRGVIPALVLLCFVANWALLEALHRHDDGVIHGECPICQVLCGSSTAVRVPPDLPQPPVYTENFSPRPSCAVREIDALLCAHPHAPPRPS